MKIKVKLSVPDEIEFDLNDQDIASYYDGGDREALHGLLTEAIDRASRSR